MFWQLLCGRFLKFERFLRREKGASIVLSVTLRKCRCKNGGTLLTMSCYQYLTTQGCQSTPPLTGASTTPCRWTWRARRGCSTPGSWSGWAGRAGRGGSTTSCAGTQRPPAPAATSTTPDSPLTVCMQKSILINIYH